MKYDILGDIHKEVQYFPQFINILAYFILSKNLLFFLLRYNYMGNNYSSSIENIIDDKPKQYPQHQQYQQQQYPQQHNQQQQYPQQHNQHQQKHDKPQMVNYLKNITPKQIKQLYTLSPYKLLNLDSKSSLEHLKLKFKDLVNIVHPDRGGNKDLFNILFKAYKEIENNIKNRDNIKSQQELKNNFKTDCEDILKNQNKMKFELNKFNKIFNKNKSTINNQVGYSDFLKKNNEVINEDDDNNNKIIKHQIPTSYNNSQYGCNLLVEDNKNFSDNGSYCDIKQAYTEKKNLDVKNIEKLYNRDFKSIEKERNNIKMTETEQAKYNQYQEYLKKQNETFHQNLLNNDKNINNNYNNLNQQMINM
jgi:hypothetical protein